MEAHRFRFGLFEFDTAIRELRREGVLIRLQSQPARVLACLVAAGGQVVSRDDLRKAIWGDETYVDFDRGLNFCIAQIRSALGDDSTTPRYVRTLPKRGYQFIAPVEAVPATANQAAISAAELDGSASLAGSATAVRRFPGRAVAVSGALLLLLAVGFGVGYWARAAHRARPLPIVAVARFDNETGDPAMTRFSDALTDTLVEQLTARGDGHYRAIGNASILRVPRDQRDLTTIASSLHAGYVVLGQVQSGRSQTRILAHLIRLPDQTHLWVVRLDGSAADPLASELATAQKIASAFSPRLVQDSTGTPLPPFPNH